MKHILIMNIRCWLILILFLTCLCSPERDNPLDPKSANNNNDTILAGRVQSRYAPNEGLADIYVHLAPGNVGLETNQNGNFQFPPLPPGEYTLRTSHELYAPDTLSVFTQANDTCYVNFNLDGLPLFSDLSGSTQYFDRWYPGPLYRAYFSVNVTDIDGFNDIDSVFIEVQFCSVIEPIRYNPDFGLYEITLIEQALPVSSLHDLMGEPIHFLAQDRLGKSNRSEPFYLTRIIDLIPRIVTPDTSAITDSRPILIWEEFRLPFSTTFKVEVYRTDIGTPVFIWEKNDIPTDSTQVRVEPVLDTGSYYWTLSVIDSKENFGRTKTATFIVEE